MPRYNDAQELITNNFPKLEISSANLKDSEIGILIERAYDIRKFEIDLYWKRAVYFWGFLVAAFTALFIVCDPTKNYSSYLKLIVCSIGFIFSLSWYLINRGSKYWQEQWEKVIDTLEGAINRPLYKLSLLKDTSVFDNPFHQYPYSVTRINIIVSLFICIIWLFSFLYELIDTLYCSNCVGFYIKVIIAGLTFGTAILLFFGAQASWVEKIEDKKYALGMRE